MKSYLALIYLFFILPASAESIKVTGSLRIRPANKRRASTGNWSSLHRSCWACRIIPLHPRRRDSLVWAELTMRPTIAGVTRSPCFPNRAICDSKASSATRCKPCVPGVSSSSTVPKPLPRTQHLRRLNVTASISGSSALSGGHTSDGASTGCITRVRFTVAKPSSPWCRHFRRAGLFRRMVGAI
jgi:hypothetical protein